MKKRLTSKTLVIAEAGVNHNGSFDIAIEMADVAKDAGADIVKFQVSITSTSKFSRKAKYQELSGEKNESQLDMLKKLRLSFDEHIRLKEYCDQIGIRYLATPFDRESVELLYALSCDMWKIPSGEIINIPHLKLIGSFKQRIILSTGISSMDEIRSAIRILNDSGSNDITLLQCTTEYPTPYEDVNLNAMLTLRDEFNLPVGLSDHSMGIEIPIAAVAMGACVIEKHFTLDRNMPGPDQKASLEPHELKQMVQSIRNIELALGDGKKIPRSGELENKFAARKSIVALRNIKQGEVFTEENIVPRHAGKGISPSRWYEVLGQCAKRDFMEDEMIEL